MCKKTHHPNQGENIAQQAASNLMDNIVKLWVVIIYGLTDIPVEFLEKIESWQLKTVSAIRTGRFRENQLENLPAFKPMIQACKIKMDQTQMLCPYMVCRADYAYGRIEKAKRKGTDKQ
jgi:hypothetical protein